MRQLQQLQQLLLRQTAADVVAAAAASSAIGGSSSVAGPVPHPDAVHFGARQMMDFHYGDMVNHHHSMDDGHASSSAPGHASSDVISSNLIILSSLSSDLSIYSLYLSLRSALFLFCFL